MYIETSIVPANSKARLVSPSLTLTSGKAKCLTFWYSMYGRSINDLKVYFKHGRQLGAAVWSKHGTQGPTWTQAQVDVTGNSPLNVVIEASKGSSMFGDIAIDDVSIVDGSCSGN